METASETIPGAAQPATEEEIFVAKIENSALLDAPVYESHQRGKNWMATITCDPAAPGGYARNFCKRGNGVYYYIVDQFIVGKAIEFAGDYYSARGSKSARRYYGVIISLTDTEIRIKKYATGRLACKAAEENIGPDRVSLSAERVQILARLAEINIILGNEGDE